MDILPFASRSSQVSVGRQYDRYGNQLSISSSSNSTLKTHQISKTPTHSGVISSTGIASPAAAASGSTSRGKIKFSKSTLSQRGGSGIAAAEKTTTISNSKSKVRIGTPLVAVRLKMKSLIKKEEQLSRLK